MVGRRWRAAVVGAGLAACGGDVEVSTSANSPVADARPPAPASDATAPATDAAPLPDVPASVPGDAGPPPGDRGLDLDSGPAPGTRVETDLAAFLTPLEGATGRASVREAAGPDDLLSGPSAQGRPGDWVLENDRVRYVIERAARLIGPCPWGGNVIDAAARLPDGSFTEDVVGEGCLFLSVSQTFAADRFEVLADGSDGAAVLAVTGHIELLDFIHLQGMIEGFLGGANLNIPWDTETLPPLTATQYFILRPGDQGVRVVTALRNDGAAAYHTPLGHFIDSGGSVEFFNPNSSLAGFGYKDLSPQTLTGEKLTLLAFRGARGSHAYVPTPDPALSAETPSAGLYITVSGVAVTVFGRTDVLSTLLANQAQIPEMPGLLHLAPGATEARVHWQYAGTNGLSSMLDAAYRDIGLETGEVRGTVREADGTPAAGARVSAITPEGRTWNQAVSGADGMYTLRVPVGPYAVRAMLDTRAAAGPEVTVATGAPADADVSLPGAGRLVVRARRPDGTATAAKITVMCDGPCRDQPAATERDVTFDGPLEGSAATVFTGVEGEATIPLAAGRYFVTVTRGLEWSVWPPDAVQNGGRAVEIAPGQASEVTAEIAHVVDSRGAVTGDFHVHAVPSPDSPISLEDRVRSFLSEGVDVIVSTDHDVITDYTPVISALEAGAELAGVIGEELTTFDYGHFNGFPLARDASANGGAFDWAGGPEVGKTPAEIFDFFEGFPGTQVIQINHPNSGYFRALLLDPLRGISRADPSRFRMPPTEPDPITGDTGLWDEGFTALEMLNGFDMGKFYTIMRWWLAMVGRGFRPTATAVSDTHRSVLSQAGGPRSYVFVSPDHDTPSTLDREDFAVSTNAGRLVGTSGPFMRITAHNGDGDSAGLGETLAAAGGRPVEVEVALDLPAWMRVDTLELYANVTEGVDVGAGAIVEEPLPPTATHPIELTDEDLVEAARGTESHRHYVKTVRFQYTPPEDVDAYLVVVVRQTSDQHMFPVIHKRHVRAMAFSNPIYLDTDGGGYDHPPLAERARMPLEQAPARPVRGPARWLDKNDVIRLLEETAHDH